MKHEWIEGEPPEALKDGRDIILYCRSYEGGGYPVAACWEGTLNWCETSFGTMLPSYVTITHYMLVESPTKETENE